jgi:peptide/nickel transport system substrate-binding protein
MERSYWHAVVEQRLSRRRGLALTGAASLGAAVLAACGGGKSSSGTSSDSQKSSLIAPKEDTTTQAKPGGVSRYFVSADSNNLDPSLANSPLESVQRHAYSGLLQEKAGYLKATDFDIIPDLAESTEWSADGLQLTLKLRQGVKWHNKAPVNGRLFDVEDVVFSWNRFAKMGAARSSVANAANPDAPILSISAPDARTVVVKLKQPVAYLTSMLGTWITGMIRMFPKEADDKYDPRNDIIGTGPFILKQYVPSVGFTLQKNPDYWEKGRPWIDSVEMPIVSEYAAGLAQLKAANLYTYTVRGEDAVSLKNEVPAIGMYQSVVNTLSQKTIFGWLPAGKSPFNDERVRQAVSMSYDRDLYIDTYYNVSKFQAQGLPVETHWNSHLPVTLPSWWLDPQSKDFGPNAKYFLHDVAEAKKLMAAAGYASGLDLVSTTLSGAQYGPDHNKLIEVLEGMAKDIGIRTTIQAVDYTSVFQPKFRDSKGNFDGISYKIGAPIANDAVANLVFEYYSKGGVNFFGFDANGKGDNSGDPTLDAQIEKATTELDTEKRKSIVKDIQRYLGGKMYGIRWPGGASGFDFGWPALRNFDVFHRDAREINYTMWIDDTQPPLKKA